MPSVRNFNSWACQVKGFQLSLHSGFRGVAIDSNEACWWGKCKKWQFPGWEPYFQKRTVINVEKWLIKGYWIKWAHPLNWLIKGVLNKVVQLFWGQFFWLCFFPFWNLKFWSCIIHSFSCLVHFLLIFHSTPYLFPIHVYSFLFISSGLRNLPKFQKVRICFFYQSLI